MRVISRRPLWIPCPFRVRVKVRTPSARPLADLHGSCVTTTGTVSAEGGRGASPELFGKTMEFQETDLTEMIFIVAPAGAPREPWPLNSLDKMNLLA